MLYQWSNWGIDVLFRHILSCFQHCTKTSRGFNPPHLKRCWNHHFYLHACLLWKNITTIPCFPFFTIQPPKTILDVPFSSEIFAQSGASVNAWIKRSSTCSIWSIAPPRAVFSLFSFTEETHPCGVYFNENYKSGTDLNAFDLWEIAAIGETFILVGKSPLKVL